MATKSSTSEEDSVAAPVVEVCSPSQTIVEPMSRRRMAFRPPTEPLSSAGTTNVQKIELSTAECSSGTGLSRSISGALINEEERPPKKSKTWNHDEIMVFYEGLKQCGKDFDGIMRIMAKKKVEKNKEQTKNYYFNLLKHVKQSISLDEDSMGDIGRDAKELFITINACEWRRRTNNNQYIPDRMKELIFYGATTIPIRDKSKKKSGPIKIKTPPCPSLLKFFYNSNHDKFPSEIIVSLKPMTYSDASYVVSCEQNPLLRIRLNTNDRIARIFQLLRHKWSSALDRVDANGSRRMSGSGPEIRLFAGKDTEVGRVVLNATEPSPAAGLSLNRLKKEREDRDVLMSKRDRNAQVNTDPSYTVTISHNFVLNEEVMKNGLCEANVRDAIVAEIYCLCGMTSVVELVYNVRTTPRSIEPWRIMVSLLERDYGEAIIDTSRRRASESTSERKDEPPAKSRTLKNCKTKLTPQGTLESPLNIVQEEVCPQTSLVVQPVLSESSVVVGEYDNFAEQLNSLSGKKRNSHKHRASTQASAPSSSRNQVTSFIAPKLTTTPLRVEAKNSADIMLGNQVSQYKARCAVERANSENQGISVEKAATDFSELCPTSFAHDFLSSLRTPEKTPAKNKHEEDRSELMHQLFGGDLSLSPSRTNESTLTSSYRHPVENAFGRCDLMERALSEASLTPSKMRTYFMQQQQSFMTLPDDVRTSMDEMMNQDSRDYVKKFEQLANTITASRSHAASERTFEK